jgi:acyl dehydratase
VTASAGSPDGLVARLEAAAHRSWVDEQVVDPVVAVDYAKLHRYAVDTVDVAPPGLGAALTMRAVLRVLHDDALDLPFDRNVHASQQLEWPTPLRLGSVLSTTARIDNVRARGRAVFFDVRTETTDENGDVCLRGVATQAVRHA